MQDRSTGYGSNRTGAWSRHNVQSTDNSSLGGCGIVMPPYIHRRAFSDQVCHYDPSMESNLELFLPKDLIDELVEQPATQEDMASLEKFEALLNDQLIEQALETIDIQVRSQTDPKAKGKLLRSAAEMARRQSQTGVGMELYSRSTTLDPQTVVSWIDRAKLLDELGDYAKAEEVLQEGVFKAQHPEQLIRKLLKSFERTNNLAAARAFLGSVVNDSRIDREVVLTEGGLFEMRQGNLKRAMDVLNEIRRNNGWKPNIYTELVQYYEKCGLINKAFNIVEEGARLNSRNAVVCQALLKNQPTPEMAIELLRESSSKWTPEFLDKMTTTVCESLAQEGHIRLMRLLLAETLAKCGAKQRHKLLLTASTIELMHGDLSIAPLLVDLTVNLAPYKSKPMVFVLWAKMYELTGEYDKAQGIFERTMKEFSAEWRVFLEFAQFYVHRNRVDKAIEVIDKALETHHGSGRLWAFRVQLEAFVGVEAQIAVLRQAIEKVPKSGEVWCEAARIALNPLTEYFNLASAKKYLEFAYRFTPQHGDSLIEMLRVEVLEKGPYSDFSEIKKKFMCSEGYYGLLFIFIRHLNERPLTDVFDDALREVQADVARNRKAYARAMARSSFVVRSIAEEKDKFNKMRSEEPPSKFAFGLTNFVQMMLNPSLCKSREQILSIVLGTSACGQQ